MASFMKILRGTALVSAATLCAVLAAGVAHGQQSLANLAEPTRFALVIGNASYAAERGNLPPLGSPCSDDKTADSDAKIVADALGAAKWDVEMVCNLSTVDLKTKISDFNDRVLAEPRAFGMIYFSGHGAQVAGTNYLFGVDAQIDEKREFAKFDQNSYAPLFGGSAVSLDEAMRKIQPLWGKAVAMFIDACRTNPILDKLRDEGINTIRYPSATSQTDNILYAFSTRDGLPSPDGGLGGVSRYARVLASTIRAQVSADPEEIEQLVSTIGTRVIIDSRQRQFTGRAGSLQRPPRFCIRGCPSLAEDWQSYNEQFGPRKPSKISSAMPAVQPAFARSVRVSAMADAQPMLRPVSWQGAVVAQAAADPVRPEPLPGSSAPAASSSGTTRKVRFDVLYCAGDAYSERRRLKAEGIQAYLGTLTGSNSPVGGFEVGEVRLVAVPPAVNQSLYKVRDSVLMYNRDSPAQKDWATRLQASLSAGLRIEEKPGLASDYMTILVCDGAVPADAGPTIYVQAANKGQLDKASAIGALFAQRLPNARIAKGVEVVAKSPSNTEVRFFSQSEAADAASVARAVEEVLDQPVKTRLVMGYEGQLNGSRLVEVWIGKKESP